MLFTNQHSPIFPGEIMYLSFEQPTFLSTTLHLWVLKVITSTVFQEQLHYAEEQFTMHDQVKGLVLVLVLIYPVIR